MKFVVKLKDSGRSIEVDPNRLTVRARKNITAKFKKEPLQLVEDKEILTELEKQFKDKPPTQMEIYKGFTKLVHPAEKEDEEDFFHEVCRVCCFWLGADGKPERGLTEDEYQDLPYDVALHIFNNTFSKSEKSFLEVPLV